MKVLVLSAFAPRIKAAEAALLRSGHVMVLATTIYDAERMLGAADAPTRVIIDDAFIESLPPKTSTVSLSERLKGLTVIVAQAGSMAWGGSLGTVLNVTDNAPTQWNAVVRAATG